MKEVLIFVRVRRRGGDGDEGLSAHSASIYAIQS